MSGNDLSLRQDILVLFSDLNADPSKTHFLPFSALIMFVFVSYDIFS